VSVITIEKRRARIKLRPQPRQYCVRQRLAAAGGRESLSVCRTSGAWKLTGVRERNMTASTIKPDATAEDHHIAKDGGSGARLTVLENAIPSPLAGRQAGTGQHRHAHRAGALRLAARRHGCRCLRVVAGSLLFGQLPRSRFFLSLSGAVCSLAVLALSMHLPQRWFGPVTDSILAAFAHIGRADGRGLPVLIPHSGIAYLIPSSPLRALVFGTVERTGRGAFHG